MCIIFAACFILRSCGTRIDFLRFVSGRHDLPSRGTHIDFLRFVYGMICPLMQVLHCGEINF